MMPNEIIRWLHGSKPVNDEKGAPIMTRKLKERIEALAFIIVLMLGWKYPYLAYCLFLNVALGLVGTFRHGGRHGCGNFCPRGAFYSLLPDTGRKGGLSSAVISGAPSVRWGKSTSQSTQDAPPFASRTLASHAVFAPKPPPFGFNPLRDAQNGLFRNPDCIYCCRCIDRCPRHALTMEDGDK